MKIRSVLHLCAALALPVSLVSCEALAGTNIGFGPDGVTVTPPAVPIVIPIK